MFNNGLQLIYTAMQAGSAQPSCYAESKARAKSQAQEGLASVPSSLSPHESICLLLILHCSSGSVRHKSGHVDDNFQKCWREY